MECPTCTQPLLTCEIAGVELDYCAQDHGYWFDKGELEALLHSPVPVLRRHDSGEPVGRRCPRCSAPLRRHRLSEEFELDLCPRGDGIWFHDAELGALAAKLRDGRAARELPHLDRAFTTLAAKLGGAPS